MLQGWWSRRGWVFQPFLQWEPECAKEGHTIFFYSATGGRYFGVGLSGSVQLDQMHEIQRPCNPLGLRLEQEHLGSLEPRG